MAVGVGSRLSQYELTALIGEGGMGRVFKGHDTKLGRSVAVKVLPDALATDGERIARFEREAKMLASLNHPNIASLIGMDHADGVHFIVMEMIDGETIADRLQLGAIPEKEAVTIAVQIAEALEAAHERGVVHRDLKPANVKLTADGKVKVLDFGLAKAMEAPGASEEAASRAANSPTLSMMATQAGLILGTAAYMSPEQAKGVNADARSDIFSFGCVLFEMLTGRQPFQGETSADILASVLIRDPDFNQLPANTDPRLRELLKRCLDKNRKRRWQAAGDLRLELEAISAGPVAAPATATVVSKPSTAARLVPLAITAIVVAAITAGTMWMLRPAPPVQGLTRFPIALPSDTRFTNFNRPAVALSPDGTRLAYVANGAVYVRAMSQFQSDLVRSTMVQLGVNPFSITFSPDGRSIAYWQSDQIRRADLDGGAAINICKAENGAGIAWYGDSLYYTQPNGIMRVAVSGGEPAVVVPLTSQEAAMRPQVLPGGRALLFTLADSAASANMQWDKARVVVQSLDTGARTIVLEGASDARYVPSIDAMHGHLLYGLAGVVFARPFDVAKLALTGPPVPMIEGVRRGGGTTGSGVLQFTVSDNGTVAYIPGSVTTTDSATLRLALFDRSGAVEMLNVPAGGYATPRLSPNGQTLAYSVNDGRDISIWVYDMAGTASPRRLTFAGRDVNPAWTADSQRVVFQSDRDGGSALYWQRADGSGTAEPLTKPEPGIVYMPLSASPDGSVLLVDRVEGNKTTVATFSFKDRTMTPYGGIVSTVITTAVFSPDGKWVAYSVRQPGRSNVLFVQPYPATGAKFQISSNAEDGHHQIWMAAGKELVFNPGPSVAISATKVSTAGGFSFSAAPGFNTSFLRGAPTTPRHFDATADGKRIIGLLAGETVPGETSDILVVLNWFQELRARAPSR